MTRSPGTTLAETMISCLLFGTFMTVTLGLFHSMTRVVRQEQNPSEQLAEARVAALSVAGRLRDAHALGFPKLPDLLSRPTSHLYLRSLTDARTYEYRVRDGVLSESHYGFRQRPWEESVAPGKGRRLCAAQALTVTSGGYAHPTRITVRIDLLDGRQVQAVSNFRESL